MKSLIKFIFCLSFVFFIIAPRPSAAADGGNGREDVVSRLEKRYQAIRTLSADFTQLSKGLSSMEGAEGGKVYFKKPARIRWTYKGSVTDEIIGDGKVLWFYQPELNQAFKSVGKQSDISTDFLSGMGRIRKIFTASVIPLKTGAVKIKLQPRKTHPQIKDLSLFVDVERLLVTKFIVKDHYGNTTEVSFSHIKINAPMRDGLFIFSPPAGTAIIAQ